MIAQKGMKWREGLRLIWGVGGHIVAEEQNGRRYFYVRVSFPQASGWWPRTTETCSVDEAREWIEEQENDYRAHVSTPAVDESGSAQIR